VVHAELNAILNANGRDLRGSRLYVALFPCNECAKAIIQSGIKEVIYLSDKYAGTPSNTASKRMLRAAGVNYIRMESNYEQLILNFDAE
jgi:dCMP deaminase